MPRWNMLEIEKDQDVREVKEGIEGVDATNKSL